MGLAKKWFKWSQIALAMLLVQVLGSGMQVLARVVLLEGIFVFSFLAYRHVVAALCVAPLAFYLERGHKKKFCWLVWFWLFVSSSGITCAIGLFCYGVRDTTATYATNFLSLVPIITFVFSINTRIENLKLHTRAGKMKTFGTLSCVGGALTSSLYKGKKFYIGHHRLIDSQITVKAPDAHWARGTFLLIASCITYSAWFVLQAKLQKVFPFKYWATMMTCIMVSLESVVIGLCLDRNSAAWKLGWNLQLGAIVYSGSVVSTVASCLVLWVISKRGPTYPSMFNPLALIFVALSEALIFGEAIRVGILLGMVFIILGLYSFWWGTRNIAVETMEVEEELGKTNSEPLGSQLTDIVVPSSSPTRDNINSSNINVSSCS